MKIELQRVHYMPKELKPNVLYVSEEFGAAAHLCPCGCGSKVRTPLAPTEWTLNETPNGPTLRPSIGNWQLPCQSHYWITEGTIIWSTKFTPPQIAASYHAEEIQRSNYYTALDRKHVGIIRRLWNSIRSLFQR
jgi:hypothetical protein